MYTKYDNSWSGWYFNEVYGCMGWSYRKISRGVGTKFEVGNGFKIRFWHNLWCEDQALKESLPVLYSIGHIKDALVVDYLELSSSSLLINNNNK